MSRPKSSLVDMINLGASAYSIKNQKAMMNEINSVAMGNMQVLDSIGSLHEIAMANDYHLRQIDGKLELLCEVSWNLASYFDRLEKKEEMIAHMRFTVHQLNRELDRIALYSDHYPCYSLFQIEKMAALIEEREVRVEHFSQVSMEEMGVAQALIDRVEEDRNKIQIKLSDDERTDYQGLKDAFSRIGNLYSNKNNQEAVLEKKNDERSLWVKRNTHYNSKAAEVNIEKISDDIESKTSSREMAMRRENQKVLLILGGFGTVAAGGLGFSVSLNDNDAVLVPCLGMIAIYLGFQMVKWGFEDSETSYIKTIEDEVLELQKTQDSERKELSKLKIEAPRIVRTIEVEISSVEQKINELENSILNEYESIADLIPFSKYLTN